LETIAIKVPGKDEVVKVTGSSIKNWQVRETDIGRVLEIYPGYQIANRFNFVVHSERMLPEDTLSIQFKPLQVLDSRRETGAVGIVAESEVEVNVKPNGELETLAFHQLPKKILDMTNRPVLYSYKYARHPFGLDIALHKHRQLEGISTVIESAHGTALVLPEGKVVVRILYTLRNSFKQFMQLDLPENAAIWTVLVDKKREKASRNKEGKVLIPLVRSTGNGDQLKAFRVELIYTQPVDSFDFRGSRDFSFPTVDIFMNKMRMEMFLPEQYSYNFDKGEWKEVVVDHKKHRPKKPVLKKGKKEIKKISAKPGLDSLPKSRNFQDEKSKDDTYNIDGVNVTDPGADIGVVGGVEGGVPGGVIGGELKEEIVVTGKLPSVVRHSTTVTPIKIDKLKALGVVTGPVGLDSIAVHLPISGKKFIFTKKIIDKGETYPLSFSFFHRQGKKWLYITGLLIIFLILLLFTIKYIKNRRLKH
jgi:hypothetical protein